MLPPDVQKLVIGLRAGEQRALARAITLVENDLPGSPLLLQSLLHAQVPRLVGITGPPGAGKSTLVNALLNIWTNEGKKVAVLAVDPSSPFHFGSLLGDRIRMARFYDHPDVFIRSLASRGALGGLHPRIFEIADVVKEAGYDYVLIETVGVGQSEVEIAGLADCTVVTLVPEAGDMIQTMKAGLLEIADVFVVNKADRPEADKLWQNLRILAHQKANGVPETPVLKTIAGKEEGVSELAAAITHQLNTQSHLTERQQYFLVEKVYRLIQSERMKPFSKKALLLQLQEAMRQPNFNIYVFAQQMVG
ncbi:MAG: methylmalonyl Co-A mutase-associated GTPase MeaB [Bacteroidetes bacterium]|nr:methylmalonyl Co-A mutase-associated GTPase MeaB [Bacteroidota bacterium]